MPIVGRGGQPGDFEVERKSLFFEVLGKLQQCGAAVTGDERLAVRIRLNSAQGLPVGLRRIGLVIIRNRPGLKLRDKLAERAERVGGVGQDRSLSVGRSIADAGRGRTGPSGST